jgi:glycoside/pentoside/hexuronide:cation symporter, GPH family
VTEAVAEGPAAAPVARPGLGRGVLAAYAAPSLPLAAMYFPVYVFLAEFYAGTHGLSLAAIGTVFIAVRLFDGVSDPVMGIVSDRVVTRWGRRRVWLALGCPLVMLGAWMLFVPPEGVGIAGFTAWLFVLTLGWTIMLTPYFTWGAELSGDYAERGRIAVWRETAGLVGTILAAVLYSLGETAAAGMALVAVMIVAGLPLATGACLAAVPEPRDYSRVRLSVGSIFGVLRGEPLFGRLLAAYFVNGAANGLPAGLFIFFVSQRLGAPDLAGPLLILYFGAAVVAAPLWPYLLGRFSKHRLWCWAMIYAGAVFSCVLFLGEGDVLAFAVICVLSGAALGADLSLPAAMQADLVDLDTARSGSQRTGAFFALWSLATKTALAVSGGVALIVLGNIGFSAEGPNEPGALWGLALLYGLAPVALKSLAIALVWSFPIDRGAQAELRARIEG